MPTAPPPDTTRRRLVRALALAPALTAVTTLAPALAGRAQAAPSAPQHAPASLDALTCLMTRRSVRSFTDAPVAEESLRAILAAGMQAPSAGNEQPWQFIVVPDAARRAALSKAHPYVGFLARAPVGIVVCGDLSLEKFKGNWMLDVSACTQNMLLAAHALGLGAVWTGLYPEAERRHTVAAICGTPEGIVPFALVVLGHPAATPPPVDRFAAVRIHRNAW